MASVGAIKAGEAFVEIGADLSRLRKGLDRAQGMLRNAGAQMRRAGMGIMAVGAAAASGLGAAAKQAGDFQSQVRDLERVTSEGVAENISQSVREMAKVMPTGTNELMRLAQTAGSLGIEGTDNIETFMEVAAQMGTATRVSAEEAGQSLGKMSNAFNIPIKQAKNMGSTIAGLAKENAAWGDEIVEAMLKSASSAGQLDMKFSDLAAIQATLISSGMQASRAGTLLNTTLTRMAGDTEKVAEALDIPLEQFRALVDENPTDALRLIAQEMGNIESRSERMAVAKEMFGIRSGKVLGQFINNIESANENLAIASNLYDEGSELQRQYNVVTKSFNSQMAILWNNVKEVGLVIGTTLLPALTNIGQKLLGVVQQIQTFVQQNREWAKIAAIAAVSLIGLGGALMAVGTMASVAGIAIGGLGSIVTAVTTVFAALGAVAAGALAVLTSPITLVVVALAGLAQIVWMNIETVKSWAATIYGALSTAAGYVKWFGSLVVSAIHKPFLPIIWILRKFGITARAVFTWIGDLIGSVFGWAWDKIKWFFTAIADLVSWISDSIAEKIKSMVEGVSDFDVSAPEGGMKDLEGQMRNVQKVQEDLGEGFDMRGKVKLPDIKGQMQNMDIGDVSGSMTTAAAGAATVGTFSAFGQGRTSGISSRLDEQTNLAREQLSEQRQMREALEDSKAVTR